MRKVLSNSVLEKIHYCWIDENGPERKKKKIKTTFVTQRKKITP